MQLNLSQQMKMSQQMKLAPRMIQSMEILMLPIMALQERIEQEMEENVVLEDGVIDGEKSETDEATDQDETWDASTETEMEQKELVVDTDHNNEADFERLLEISQEWPEDNVLSAPKPSANRIDEISDRKNDSMANMVARPQSLYEHLLEQFRFFNCEPIVREFGEYLLQNLNDKGLLPNDLPQLMQVFGKPITAEEAEYALSLIQKLEPAGVGARHHEECLLLQLQPDTPQRDVLVTLITSHLKELGQNRLPAIQRKTGYSIETIKTAEEQLKHLTIDPGREFNNIPTQSVSADLVVEQDESGKYVVRLEEEYTPQLRISPRYVDMLRRNPDPQTKEYIKKKIESAKWLIESIEQRQNTLKRVAQSIVDHQTAFLDHGPENTVPLIMQQVADVVGVHVTTVSRAVDGKWIETPRGLFPLKRFFGGGTKTAEGEDVAWGIIRLKLKEIVDQEDKDHPLSDDALVEELKKHGFQLARRTVTKYRKALDIPASRQRRRY